MTNFSAAGKRQEQVWTLQVTRTFPCFLGKGFTTPAIPQAILHFFTNWGHTTRMLHTPRARLPQRRGRRGVGGGRMKYGMECREASWHEEGVCSMCRVHNTLSSPLSIFTIPPSCSHPDTPSPTIHLLHN